MDEEGNGKQKQTINRLCGFRDKCHIEDCAYAHHPDELVETQPPEGYTRKPCKYKSRENCPRNKVCWHIHDDEYEVLRAYTESQKAQRAASRAERAAAGPSAYERWALDKQHADVSAATFGSASLAHESLDPPALSPPPAPANPQTHEFLQRPPDNSVLQPHGTPDQQSDNANPQPPFAQGLDRSLSPLPAPTNPQTHEFPQRSPDDSVLQPHGPLDQQSDNANPQPPFAQGLDRSLSPLPAPTNPQTHEFPQRSPDDSVLQPHGPLDQQSDNANPQPLLSEGLARAQPPPPSHANLQTHEFLQHLPDNAFPLLHEPPYQPPDNANPEQPLAQGLARGLLTSPGQANPHGFPQRPTNNAVPQPHEPPCLPFDIACPVYAIPQALAQALQHLRLANPQPHGPPYQPSSLANPQAPLDQCLALALPPPRGYAHSRPDGLRQHPPDHAILQPVGLNYPLPGHANPQPCPRLAQCPAPAMPPPPGRGLPQHPPGHANPQQRSRK